MISVDEARVRILSDLRPAAIEIVALAAGWGRVLAAPVVARLTQPPADVSAMDGYAVRAIDGTLGATLQIIGAAPAGHPFAGRVEPGQAVRLFTGSVIPGGADGVVIQEDVDRGEGRITLREAVIAGRHIRRAGQDFSAGDTVIAAPRRLTARDIGLAAAANHPWLTVHRRPRVAILATGDEIALPGEPIAAGGIVSSNSHALAALVRAGGGEPIVLPVAADTETAIAAVADQLGGMDMLVTTGGASVGDHDLVLSALQPRGLVVDFWKIAMRPGKPLIFGQISGVPMLGLPGNPVSALVCAILFLLPALARLSGLAGDPPATVAATLGADLARNDLRADYLRATIQRRADDSLVATAFPRQDSSMLRRLAGSNALILRPPHAPALSAGADIRVILLDSLGI